MTDSNDVFCSCVQPRDRPTDRPTGGGEGGGAQNAPERDLGPPDDQSRGTDDDEDDDADDDVWCGFIEHPSISIVFLLVLLLLQ